MSYTSAFNRGLEPQSLQTIDQWADAYRFLSSKASAEPGRFRTSRTPYLREPMRMLSLSSEIQKISFMKGVQLGVSELACNLIGYIIHRCPAPIMMVQPTIEMAERFSKTRIKTLIELSPVLRERVKDPREKDSGNTLLSKEFEGGILIMAGANAAASLCSTPIKNAILDEIDRMPDDVEGEGCPIQLVEARTSTFARKKIFLISSPTKGSKSKINKSYLEGDQRKYFVPCPYCDFYQVLVFKNIKWTPGDYSNVCYECQSCKELIPEFQKKIMLEKGEWRATAKNKDPLHISYHLSALYSPKGWYSWADAAKLYEVALKDKSKYKTFVNTVEGLPYEDTGELVDWQLLYNRRENYERNKVPKGGLFITCGVDIQHDRIECELVVWGREKESWSLDFRVFYGITKEKEVWANLDNLLREEFEVEGTNKKILIKNMAIDSSDGTMTAHVYDFCRKYNISRVFPIKGRKQMDTYFTLSAPKEFKVNGRKIPKGIKLYSVGVNLLKSEFMGFLELKRENEKTPYGYCHFPDYNEEYFLQLTSEVFLDGDWTKTRARNEALDCRIYARAAAAILGIDRYIEKDWKMLENNLSPVKTFEDEEEVKEKTESKIPTIKPKKERKRCTYWDTWR
jgi:phage terminase large subunit GpA-like protein